jgi:choline dehydrogenase-like flavoprotein
MARTIPDLPRLSQPAGLPTPKSTDSFWHTEPSPLLMGYRSTRDLPSTADVVIIGSGITGTSIARHLLKKDGSIEQNSHDVVMLEAREACWGATGRVCRLNTRNEPFQTHIELTIPPERRPLPANILRIPPRPLDWPLRARQLHLSQNRNRNFKH